MTLVEEDQHPRRGLYLLTSWTGLSVVLIGRPERPAQEVLYAEVLEHWCGQTLLLDDGKQDKNVS